MKKVTLSACRITEKGMEHINMALKKYNDNPQHLAKLTKNDFRRTAVEVLAQSILQDIPLPVQLQSQLKVSTDL